MTTFAVPELEDEAWPSLGGQVCRFIEERLVFGPGDLRGQPARIDAEKRAFIWRMYEVYPPGSKDANGKSIAGRRRWRRVALSLPKGSAKTELDAWVSAVELHPEGPVRCVGFDSKGRPIGGPVTDPYIPLVAYTEEQSEDLAYGALKAILELSRVARDFDIGLERILRKKGDGKAVALAGAPSSRDGARTTFQILDETHHWTSARLKRAATTMFANLPKRLMADPWSLETTTAYSPGERSVAEETHEYARAVAEGKVSDSRLFFYHRQASDGYDLKDLAQLRAAVKEALGPQVEWRDVEGIVDQWQSPNADEAFLERVWLNRPVQVGAKAFDAVAWERNRVPCSEIPEGALVTLGFDGSRSRDATGIVVTEVASGLQAVAGVWEHPGTPGPWTVPEQEVDSAVDEAFARWNVWRMYCDPYWWESYIAAWAGRHGEKRVIEFRSNRLRVMATALQAFATAIVAGEVLNDGNRDLARHVAAACKLLTQFRDEEGRQMWTIQKEGPDSPFKIDLAMAACLSWEARNDAIASGAIDDAASYIEPWIGSARV